MKVILIPGCASSIQKHRLELVFIEKQTKTCIVSMSRSLCSPHTVESAHYSGCRIISNLCDPVTEYHSCEEGKKGQGEKKEQRMPCLPLVGMGRGGRRGGGGGGGEKKYIYTTYILVCVHNVEEVFL